MSRPPGSKNKPKGNPSWGNTKQSPASELYQEIDGFKRQEPKVTVQFPEKKEDKFEKKSKRAKPDRLLYILCDDKTWHTIQEKDLESWIKDGSIKEGDMIILPRVIKVAKKSITLINKG